MYYLPILISTTTKQEEKAKAEEIARTLLKEKASSNNPNYINLETEKSSLGIKDIKTLIKSISLKPFSGKITVIFIHDIDKATIEAQNALLKTLEEPAENIQLILGTTNIRKILPTILSRCIKQFYSEEKEFDLKESTRFFTLNIGDQFKEIPKILEMESSSKSQSYIEEFLDNLLIYLQKDIVSNYKSISKILKYKNYISSNVNKKTALESLILEINN